MNILIVTRSLPFHQTGGMEVVAWDLARSLSLSGQNVRVLTTPAAGLSEKSVVQGVEIRTVPSRTGRYSRQWWRGSAALYDRELSENTDIVLSVSVSANAIVELIQGRPRRPLCVMQAHGTMWGEVQSKLAQKSIKGLLSAVVTFLSGAVRDRTVSEYDAIVAIGDPVIEQIRSPLARKYFARVPLTLIRNGVDSASFTFDGKARSRFREMHGIDERAFVVLSLGRLHAQKGLLNALEIVERCSAHISNLQWIIAGDGPLENELRARIEQSPLKRQVHLLGKVAREDVASILSASDTLLFPTLRKEGLPVSILEALASGLPVVTSVGGCDSSLPCQFVDKNDLEGFSKALATALDNAGNRLSKLPAEYTLDYSTSRYVGLFEQLISSNLG